MEFIIFKYNKRIWHIKTSTIIQVLSMLEKQEIKFESLNQIKKLMKKYKLFNRLFLENLFKI